VVFDVGVDQQFNRFDPSGDGCSALGTAVAFVAVVRIAITVAPRTLRSARANFFVLRTFSPAVTFLIASSPFARPGPSTTTNRLDFQIILVVVVEDAFFLFQGFVHGPLVFDTTSSLGLAVSAASPSSSTPSPPTASRVLPFPFVSIEFLTRAVRSNFAGKILRFLFLSEVTLACSFRLSTALLALASAWAAAACLCLGSFFPIRFQLLEILFGHSLTRAASSSPASASRAGRFAFFIERSIRAGRLFGIPIGSIIACLGSCGKLIARAPLVRLPIPTARRFRLLRRRGFGRPATPSRTAARSIRTR
jgi:hypothetical protein